MRAIVFFVFLTLSTNAVAQMPSYIQDFQGRQENKKSTRWTIADWASTQQKVALMDQWLAMNSSANLFDFYLYGSIGKLALRSTSDTDLNESDLEAHKFATGIFVSIFGLEGELDSFDDVQVNRQYLSLRLLGTSLQSTNLVLKAGIRTEDSKQTETELLQYTMGADLTLYLFKRFGFTFSGQKVNLATDKDDNKVSGYYGSAQAFIEADFLRVSATYFEEAQNIEMTNQTTNSIRSGWLVGISFHW